MRTILLSCAAALAAAGASAMSAARGTAIPFTMPCDGKATIVLDDAEGRRVRNLVSGIAYPKGRHEVEWDGRAEDGTGAPAGTYTVRVATHRGIGYAFRGCFAAGGEQMFSGFGPNHLPCTMLAPAGDGVVAAALFTEGGNSTLVLSHEGRLLAGHADGWNLGNKACAYLAAEGRWAYAVREAEGNVLQAFGYATDSAARREVRLADAPPTALKGAARIGGRVYLSNGLSKTVDVYALEEPADGGPARLSFTGERRPCAVAGPLCADGDALVLPFKEGLLSLAAKGAELFALERGSHTVHVYDRATLRETRAFGTPGGGYTGPWDRNRLVEPVALAFDGKGALWIAENRYSPKRISRWNAEKGVCEYEKTGGEKYGSPGCGMDGADPTRWIAHDTEWRCDPEHGIDGPVASLFDEKAPQTDGFDLPPRSARTYRFVRRGARTYLIGNDGATTVWEYLDGEKRLKPLAMFGSPGFYAHMIGRDNTCEPIRAAYAAAFGEEGDGRRFKFDEETLMVWRDRNGDERMQADEFAFAPRGTGGPGGWGLFASGLDFTCCLWMDGTFNLVDFTFPDYAMDAALKTRRPLKGRVPSGAMPRFRAENYTTADGHFIYPTLSPYMLGFAPDGTLAWYMKNPFPNVHGSHDAPMPRPGELQGILFPLGSVPGGARGEYEVCALKNNHGRVFFITSDGLYLDEIFSDCRVACANDETYIGGESFGGSFDWDARGRRAVLTSGGGGYRLYDVTGLDTVSETRFARAFSARDLAEAQARHPLAGPADAKKMTLAVPDGADPARVAEWRAGDWRIALAARRRDGRLRLSFRVEEPSPWVNNGQDPYLMFKTGDCVDFQYLDGAGEPCRLMVFPAPDGAEAGRAVLYRHAAKGGNAHVFASPWRRHVVGDVSFPEDLDIRVRRGARDYEVAFDVPGAFAGARRLACDFGVIFGDRDGTINQSRVYWSNKETGLVNDVPGEIMPEPAKWGEAVFGGAADAGPARPADAPRAAARLRALPPAVNPGGLFCAPAGRGHHGPAYAAGPVYDAARGLLYASAGQGRVNAMTLDGRPAGSCTLPGARAFDRFDSLALDPRTGDVYALAGGLAAQDPARPQARAGLVYRIAPGAAEGVCVASNVCAISQRLKDGRLMCMTPQSTLDWLDGATGARAPLCTDPVRLGAAYPCLLDFMPDGTPVVFAEHSRYFLVDAAGRLSAAHFPFGAREISMTRGAILGDEAWMLSGGTVKRYAAPSMKPAPGVVYGGASGYFIGHVEMDSGLHAVGICALGEKGLYAVLSAENSAVYVMRYDPAAWRLVPEKRLGGVADPCNFLLDDDGVTVADSLAWRWGAPANAPTCTTLVRQPPRLTAVLPDGRVLHVTETHGSRIEFRRGRLLDGELAIDHNRDSRPYPEGAEAGRGQVWGAYRPVASFARAAGDRRDRLKAYALRADGLLSVYALDGDGHPLGESFCRETRLPRPAGVAGDFTALAPLPDGRLVAQAGGRAFLLEPGAAAPLADVGDCDWSAGACVPALDGDALAADGAALAVADAKAGTLALFAWEDGAPRALARADGLAEPRRVALRGARAAVWEAARQRVACFAIE